MKARRGSDQFRSQRPAYTHFAGQRGERLFHIIAIRGTHRFILESVYGRKTAEREAGKYQALEGARIEVEPDSGQ